MSKELKNRAGIPQSGIANHDTIIKLADNLNKKMTFDGLHAYVSKLHAPLVSQIGTVGFGSASGALGELLFELLEGRTKLKYVPKQILLRSLQDTIITVSTAYAPLVSILIAACLGIYGIYSFVSNKVLSSRVKFLLIGKLIVKTTLKSTMTLGVP